MLGCTHGVYAWCAVCARACLYVCNVCIYAYVRVYIHNIHLVLYIRACIIWIDNIYKEERRSGQRVQEDNEVTFEPLWCNTPLLQVVTKLWG